MNLADARFSIHGNVVVAHLLGEIDMSNADGITRALLDSTTNDALGLVLDLRAVDYLDSTGIRLIYSVRESLRTRGQGLRLIIEMDSIVGDALRLSGVARHMAVTDTVEAAIAALRDS
jgi:anti-anti-sigma factor